MTREEAKKMLPIIQAYADGKTIEHYCESTQSWIGDGGFGNYRFTDMPSRYRVKTEPEYVPFTSYVECWEEMMKHSYIGWVKCYGCRFQIVRVESDYVMTVGSDMKIEKHCFDYMFENYTFIDGTPFGKLKE